MMFSMRAAAWGVVVATAVVTAACGGGTNGGNAGSAPTAAGVHVPANFCGLLSGADISQVMGRAFPAPQGTQSSSEAQCASVPAAGGDVSFKLYWDSLYCVEGKPPDGPCLAAQSKGFFVNRQTAGNVQDISGLGDHAFCFVAPPATLDVLEGWVMTVQADSCVQAQTLAGMLLAKITA
jgi:hypothetical protein